MCGCTAVLAAEMAAVYRAVSVDGAHWRLTVTCSLTSRLTRHQRDNDDDDDDDDVQQD